MRLRNVKNKDEILNSSKYLTNDYKIFDNPFGKNVHIEIGMGKGDFIINMAKKYPNINFIGIEKYDSVIARAVQKLDNEDIPNLHLIKMKAEDLSEILKNSVDTVYLNFSDPWPKDRHQKRRLTHEVFLKEYDKLFSKNCRIVMKTDNRHLFEFSLKSFTDYGYKIQKLSLDLYKDDIKDNVPTEYEKRFNSLGYPIYMVEVIKN